jgi:tRNA-modifying protein YgfZ
LHCYCLKNAIIKRQFVFCAEVLEKKMNAEVSAWASFCAQQEGLAYGSEQAIELYPLDQSSNIAVIGLDAIKFLQGQTTCDLRRLAEGHWLMGAQCNPKGRMMSSFIATPAADGVEFRLHLSLLESAQAALKKYAVFSKVRIEHLGARRCVALMGAQVLEFMSGQTGYAFEPGQCLSWNDLQILVRAPDWVECCGDETALMAVLAGWSQRLRWHASAEWDGQLIARGIAEVRGETQEMFIPQMFNFDRIDAVSFKKGCYTGQEIVARMQYLGKLKKHLYAGRVQGYCPRLVEDLQAPGNAEAQGQVVLAWGSEFLAVVNDAAIEADQLFFAAFPDLKIDWSALPYAIP